MQKTILATLLLSSLNFLRAQDKTNSDEVNIRYEKFQLPNGLTLLVHEDHSDPIVYVDVTYHVGSAREQQGRSGFAHFFEHMMFQGSKHVADEQHFKIITEAGGTLNGSTNSDRTNYFETVPSDQLEKMLWLEADRMGFLLDSVTQKKFEVQRATVKNERGQRYDNAPYGLVGEKIGEALYPKGHPYSWTTIGYIADLNRVDVNDLKRFYMRWYGPNNAVLTVAGDVYTGDVLRLAEKYFGPIKKGPEVKLQEVATFQLTENRYISYEDNVKFPSLNYAWPTADIKNRDDAALDVLATILSGSQGSPFYKAFIETGKAVSVNSYQYSRELAGQFQLTLRANPTTSLADLHKEVMAVFTEFEKKGVSEDDLVKFKTQYKSDLYNRLSTVQGKGATLASNFIMMGDADYLKKEIERYMSITRDDVMRVYKTYIQNKPAVVLSCLPKGKGDLRAQADNWKMYERTVEPESAEYKNLTFTEPKDNFDRSQMPNTVRDRPAKTPPFSKPKLPGNNSIPVILSPDDEIPKVNILISFKKGHRFEPKEKSGLAELTAAMLGKSTLQTKAEEIENKLDRLGSNVQFSAGDEDLNITVQCLKQNLDATLKIVQESLFEPKFDNAEFEIEKKKQLDKIAQMQTNAAVTADAVFKKVLYGNSHIMGFPSFGTTETVSKLDINDVKDYYKQLNNRLNCVAVCGAITTEETEKALNFLSKYTPLASPDIKEPELPVNDKTKIYFVDKKNAAQSEIRVGNMSAPFIADPVYYKSVMLNFSFAGAFNSRVNYLLREVKGWTYGVRGTFYGTRYEGPYIISGGFKANTTDSTIKELFRELKKFYDNGITDEELQFTKSSLSQSEALKYESPVQKLYYFKRILDYRLPDNYVFRQQEILKNSTIADLNALLKVRFRYNNMFVVVVGDKSTNLEKVKKLGYEVIELDTNGNPIK